MRITTTKKFDKQYKKLADSVKKKFEKKIYLFVSNMYDPNLGVHKLHGKFDGCMSINITGDVRLILQVREERTILLLIEIGSHSELYS